jgi:hypothetical protein
MTGRSIPNPTFRKILAWIPAFAGMTARASQREFAHMAVKSDIEIAREAKMKPIAEIGKRIGIPDSALLNYGP